MARTGEVSGVLIALALGTGLIMPASAEECRPLTSVTAVQLVPGPASGKGHGMEFVPVTIDGISKQLLLDTGSAGSEISASAADDLKLTRHRWRVVAAGEPETAGEQAVAQEFSLGTITGSAIPFTVSGESGGDPQKIGTLGTDFLRHYDVDVDFPVHALKFFSQDHCVGKVVYWQAAALAVIPFHVTSHGRILLPITLDGQSLQAILDTGSAQTVVPESVAVNTMHLDLSPGAPGVVPSGTDDSGPVIARHKIASLSFAGSDGGQVAIGNVEVRIVSDAVRSGREESSRTASRLLQSGDEETAPVHLGMNVLRHLHVYIAYGENRLYISPGSNRP